MSEASHWHKYPARRALFEPPLRPHPDVVALLRMLVGEDAGPVLLLGVTSAIAEAFRHGRRRRQECRDGRPHLAGRHRLEAGGYWRLARPRRPGAPLRRRPRRRQPEHAPTRGDRPPAGHRRRPASPGGRFACRLFERPEPGFSEPTSPAARRRPAGSTSTPSSGSWRCISPRAGRRCRWPTSAQPSRRVARPRSAVPRHRLVARVDRHHRPRRRLVARLSFPSRAEFLRLLPPGIEAAEFLACGSYDLAECCPVLTFRKPLA